MSLEDLNLDLNTIYECLIITINENSQPNIAPMGVLFDSTNTFVIQPYIKSDTFRNILKNRLLTIHFTKDPYLFTIGTLFQEELSSEDFVKIPGFDAYRLKKLDGNYLVADLVYEENIDIYRVKFKYKIIHTALNLVVIQPFTRAFSLLIEILIDASRVVAFSNDDENKKEIPALLQRINTHSEIIRRVSNETSIYITLLEKILNRINSE